MIYNQIRIVTLKQTRFLKFQTSVQFYSTHLNDKVEPSHIVKFDDCSLAYYRNRTHPVFKKVTNFIINPGDKIAIIGTSSSGRTFLLESIHGDHAIIPNEKLMNDEQVIDFYLNNKSLRSWKWIKQNMRSVSFQEHSQFSYSNPDGQNGFYQQRFESQGDTTTLTLRDFFSGKVQRIIEGNFDNTILNNQKDKKDIINKRKNIVDRFLKTTSLTLDTTMMKLSNGQLRRARLVAAVLDSPSVLLLDEPFMGLDQQNQFDCSNMIYDEFLKYNTNTDSKPTLILAMRPQDLLPEYINKIILVGDNKILWEGKKEEYESLFKNNYLLKNSKIKELGSDMFWLDNHSEKYLGYQPDKKDKSKFILNTIINNNKYKKDEIPIVKEDLNIPNEELEDVIKFDKVNISYGSKTVLKNISFSIKKGEKWVLWGGNGSGKSTLLSLIVGDHPQAFSNNIYLFNERRGSGETIFDLKRKCGVVSPELHYYFRRNLTVEESIFSRFDLIADKPPKETIHKLTHNLLAEFGIISKTILKRKFVELSTAEQKLILFIRAVIMAPELIILDEPFQGMDFAVIHKCHNWLKDNIKDNQTLILVTHDLNEIPNNINKMIFLKDGEIKSMGRI